MQPTDRLYHVSAYLRDELRMLGHMAASVGLDQLAAEIRASSDRAREIAAYLGNDSVEATALVSITPSVEEELVGAAPS